MGVGGTGNRGYASAVKDGNGQLLSDVVAVSAASQHLRGHYIDIDNNWTKF